MLAVRAIFRRVIADAPAAGEIGALELGFFKNRALAERALSDLGEAQSSGHISRRTRQGFRKLHPLLLTQLARIADPDATVTRLVRFAEAFGLRSKLFELLVVNPRLLELLVKTLDTSRYAADLLVRRPHLLEEITRGRELDQRVDVTDHSRALRSVGTKQDALEQVRVYRQTQTLRIILRDLLGLSSVRLVCRELADLAEACLLAVNEIVGGANLTIVALGKFGGRELSYGADLDVLFVGEEDRQAQNLLSTMAQPSAEGNLPRVDARLRPEGEQGPLIGSVDAYRRYYAGRAQLWEMQALTRARPVTGPQRGEFMTLAKQVWEKAGQQPELFARIDNMVERIRRERGSGSEFLDFKTGTGGMIEAEFLVQALQMRSATWNPNWHDALSILAERDLISKPDAAAGAKAYELLRRAELLLRRFENTPISTLPANSEQQLHLAKRLGYKEANSFVHDYQHARHRIRAIYERYVSRSTS
jgi:glutamate-ammonia-ligase adenylyltransferase